MPNKFSCVNNPRPTPSSAAAAAAVQAGGGQTAAPVYTGAQAAQQAWTTQRITPASVSIQPVGNVTLAGLPTYFAATFAQAGLAPGESVTATVLGHTITIRPSAVTYTYVFGDGESVGPTSDAGGPYPTGHITHTYAHKGYVTTRIDITVGGEFQENGGPWQPIGGTTTITGTPQRLTVAVLESRLTP